jgi:hypothetical protein
VSESCGAKCRYVLEAILMHAKKAVHEAEGCEPCEAIPAERSEQNIVVGKVSTASVTKE